MQSCIKPKRAKLSVANCP